MENAEIKKALECCTTNGASCKDCPAFVKVDRSNCKKYFRGALALINRQEADIERLNEKVDFINDLTAIRKQIKTEAYKELVAEIQTEIREALKSNYKARQEHIDKWRDPNAYIGGDFVSICEGKIAALRGIDDFINDLLKEHTGE